MLNSLYFVLVRLLLLLLLLLLLFFIIRPRQVVVVVVVVVTLRLGQVVVTCGRVKLILGLLEYT